MQDNVLASLSRLSDSELVASLKGLTARERAATAELVAHIAELETRDIHLRAGYASLFVYCRDVLALSEAEAYNRIEAARAARRFPVILRLLSEGVIHLTTVRLLAPHLTPTNHLQVLESARGKRKSEVEAMVAALAPRPDLPASVRRLPRPNPRASAAPPVREPAASANVAIPVEPAPAVGPALPESGTCSPIAEVRPAMPVIAPLAPERYRFQVTIGVETLEKLRLAKDMLRHAVPSGDEAAILDRALTALLADLARRQHAATDSPRASSGARTDSRHIPAQVRRAVWLRDGGRCAFDGDQGRRCGERAFVEFTSSPTPSAEVRRWRTSSFDVGIITATRQGSTSGEARRIALDHGR